MSSTGVRVLYVMGLWRSGSTILDIVLDNHDAIEGVGELRNLPSVGWQGDHECACGSKVRECPHWRSVRERWEAEVGPDAARTLIELQDRYERIRSLGTLLREVLSPSDEFRQYGTLVRALFEAIRDESGKEVVVDSTKYPMRALALTRVPGVDLELIHLVRDGRAITWSLQRKMNTDLQGRTLDEPLTGLARRTAWRWVRINFLCELVGRMAVRSPLRVRYEDFVEEPEGALAKIGELLELDMSGLVRALAAGEELAVGHLASGNRVRQTGQLRLRPDVAWQTALSESDRRAFWRVAGWQARRYGYPK